MKITGKYTIAEVKTDYLEESALKQILDVCNQKIFENTKIVIQPDCHAGAGCVIGFTMTIENYVVPNLIGVDIGCGMLSANLGPIEINFEQFDQTIRKNIPSGFACHNNSLMSNSLKEKVIPMIEILKFTNPERILNSIGSLGGGNHFIELGKDENNDIWLTIHSGSRNFGHQIATHYQKRAQEIIKNSNVKGVQRHLEYLSVNQTEFHGYLVAMGLAQEYASENRDKMLTILLDNLDIKPKEIIESVHNYINFKDNILRKGAISAQKDERVIIPFNMRDGLILGTGKGNPDWNYSAPHGAGRIMGRKDAKRKLNLEEFKNEMTEVWSSCVSMDTLDESPMAYKSKEVIMERLSETVEVTHFVKPIYNFKASEG